MIGGAISMYFVAGWLRMVTYRSVSPFLTELAGKRVNDDVPDK